MSTELEDLVEEFYNYFINLYRKDDAPKTGEGILAFEAIGTAITPEMFELTTGEFAQQLAVEQFSSLANQLPILDGNTIVGNSIKTVDGLYELMLFSAKSTPNADAAAFERFRSNADQAFDMSKMINMLNTGRIYRPALATPPDWCAPENSGGWTTKSFNRIDKTETTVNIGVRPSRPKILLRRWNMRVLEPDIAPALESPTAVDHVMPKLQLRVEAGRMPPTKMRSMALISEGLRTTAPPEQVAISKAKITQTLRQSEFKAQAIPSAGLMASSQIVNSAALSTSLKKDPATIGHRINAEPTASPTTKVQMIPRADVLAAQVGVLNEAASAQEVTSESITLSFDYSMVDITRPWISSELLSLKNWYMAGYQEGELASGTGTGGKPFEVLPVSAIVVRNLKIKANWSHDNKKTLEATLGFGPFSLQGRTYHEETGELVRLGMQIVGWICETMPKLPPASDPSLLVDGAAPPV
jgi:hypothetical protein